MIYLEVDGGLCNRMQAINSMYKLAKESGHQLQVLWKMSSWMNCPYEVLFELPSDIRIKNVNCITNWGKGCQKVARKYYIKKSNLYFDDDKVYAYRYKQLIGVMSHERVIQNLASCKEVYVQSSEELVETMAIDVFTPQKNVAEEVEKLMETVDGRCVGIHIRRTDLAVGIAKSPTEEFVKRMNEEIAKDERTKFYLATDDKQEEEYLKQIFDDRIIIHQREASERMSVQGTIDAYIDLLCLSRTEKIIGTFHSSFSRMAARLDGIPLEIAIKDV